MLVIGGLLSLAGNGRLGDILAAIIPASAPTVSAAETAPVPAVSGDADESEAQRSIRRPRVTIPPATMKALPPQHPRQPRLPPPSQALSPARSQPWLAPKRRHRRQHRFCRQRGSNGAQNLLDLYASAAAAPFWDEDVFSSGAGGSWRDGAQRDPAKAKQSSTPRRPISWSLALWQCRARPHQSSASRARLAQRRSLRSRFADEVYFGLLLQNADGAGTAGIQIQQVSPDVIRLAALPKRRSRLRQPAFGQQSDHAPAPRPRPLIRRRQRLLQ